MAGEGDKIAWILEDDECGQFAAVTADEVQAAVAGHFMLHHQRTGTLVEGRDWRRIEPGVSCDICSVRAELPWWIHIATPRVAEADDRDGRWLVCDPCHDLVVGKDIEELFRRTWAHARSVSPWVTRGEVTSSIQAWMRQVTELAIERFDAGTRVTL